jgi:hypothetical protein
MGEQRSAATSPLRPTGFLHSAQSDFLKLCCFDSFPEAKKVNDYALLLMSFIVLKDREAM